MKRLATLLFDQLFPPRCGFCGTPGSVVCAGCLDDLPHNHASCELCARPLAVDGICGACQSKPPPFIRVVAPMLYAYPVDAAIRAFKFRYVEHRLPSLLHLLRRGVAELPDDIDAVVAMPMHWRRRVGRGFNQAALLAGPVARDLELPLLDGVAKTRHTRPQSTLSGRDRRRNLVGAFACARRIPFRHVLIVDDVFTSGQSARHLAHALRAAGAQSVSVLVLARARQVRV